MSATSPDDSGALSPAERDFLARRMPVEVTPTSYCVTMVAPGAAEAPSEPAYRRAIRDSVIELRLLAHSLRNGGNEAHAAELYRIANEIREALK